ncbi:MAG TPA: zinc-dependent metalloprotease family protein, partial [Nitrososphaeraceae archaeon]|nr:zinc-dependent metalloprotease family protein [Nitrososphaeraceae archaeon]
MKKSLTFKSILMLIGVISIILVPATFSVQQETYANHVPNHTDCINWVGKTDKDCDGLADQWENDKKYVKNGVTVYLPSTVYWKHRDVLVEIDYMGHHEPTWTALNTVIAKFNAMTGLENPDGTTGVKLHIIKSNNIPHNRPCINIWNDGDTDDENDFDSLKAKWMGNDTERLNPNYQDVAKDIYHYFLFIHIRCGTTAQQQSAGGAEGPGNDGYVSLGYPGWGNVINGHDTGSNDYKARAFGHELGHNLGLRHGGSADYPNCKPNYISVMNYLFEFPTKIPSAAGDWDYSKNVIPELDENSLVEANGIGPSWPNGLPTGVGHSDWSHTVPHVWETTANNIQINYDWFKTNNNPPAVSSSITNFHFDPCNDNDVTNSGYNGRLWGYNDIHYNSLIFWAAAGGHQNSTGVPNAESSMASNNVMNSTVALSSIHPTG